MIWMKGSETSKAETDDYLGETDKDINGTSRFEPSFCQMLRGQMQFGQSSLMPQYYLVYM